MKQISCRQLSKLSQKYHCNPKSLTDEEWSLIPLVKEWENDYIIYEDSNDYIPSFDDIFIAIYGTSAGLEVLID